MFYTYATVLLSINNSLKLTQPSNASLPMLVVPLPIFTLVRPLQSLNAFYPMLVTESGIVTLVRLLQL